MEFIGESVGVGEGLVRYNWLIGKLITLPCACGKSVTNTPGKTIFLVITSCTQNVLLSLAMDMNVLPSAIRGLSSAPETENSMDCSGELRKVSSIIVRPRG